MRVGPPSYVVRMSQDRERVEQIVGEYGGYVVRENQVSESMVRLCTEYPWVAVA